MDDLTTRQEEILEYLQTHLSDFGTWPSFREIEKHFGFKSTNAVMGHLKALEKKGYISRVPGQARTFHINTNHNNEETTVNTDDVVSIPIYGTIAAGYPDGIEPSGEIGRLQIDVSTAGVRRTRSCFALQVRGESMIDAGIFDGDTVIIEKSPASNGDIVAALIDGETTLKRFINVPGENAYLQAENINYPNLYPIEELSIQGIAKAIVRNL